MTHLRRAALPLLLAALTVLVFDAVAWFAVPERLTAFASSYRKTHLLSARSGHPALARSDERYYFQADEATGFDIRPGARMMHEFGETPSEIFANALGCFDRNEVATLRAAPYHYFAGDSFTWGFADYDSKFATVWERATRKAAAKCGISHTGQAHQLEKFKRVAAAIGRMPDTVFVGFYVNDPANDAAFPHTTVVEGFMVDTVYLRDGELSRPGIAEVRRVVADSLRELERPLHWLERAKAVVWVFSLSANLANHARLRATGGLEPRPPLASPAPLRPSERTAPAADRPTSRFGDNLYYWYDMRTLKTAYAADPRTAANRAAIARWARHARENGYRLVLLLFPPSDAHDDPELFGQVRGFLDSQAIEHLDFARLFRAEGLRVEDLYWKTNGHWNPGGNRAVGRLLAARY
jgi:hypothetical protein